MIVAGSQLVLFAAGVAVSLGASWVLVSRLERLGERAGFSEAWLGLVAALAADAPEITSSVTALSRGQASVGAGVVTGSNVFNLAALLGLAAVVAGRVGFHRRVVLLGGIPGIWVAAVCLLTVAGLVPPAAGLALAGVVLASYVAVAGMQRARLEHLRLPGSWGRWLAAAVHDEEDELSEAIRPRPGTWRDGLAAAGALAAVTGASTVMELTATALGSRYRVADIVTGGLVLAVVTSLPNAVSAIYLARRGRGAAGLSIALNSNAINVIAGLLIPASLTGLGPRTGQAILVTAWYAGLTVAALAFAYRGRGLSRLPGTVIIAGYLAFVTALALTVIQARISMAAALPAAAIALAGTAVLSWPGRLTVPARSAALARHGRWWRRDSLLPGWTAGCLWTMSVALCLIVAACDAATGRHLILIGLLACGPCCALLTARWALTATTGGLAIALAVVLGIPDQIFATSIQCKFLAAVTIAAAGATAGAAVAQRRRGPAR
jgi:cation:H+ antiporter